MKTCGNCHGTTPKDNNLDLTSLGTAESILTRPTVLKQIELPLDAFVCVTEASDRKVFW